MGTIVYKAIAARLNEEIEQGDPQLFRVLSRLGRRIYFDSEGILSQSAEARQQAALYNATLGTAIENGEPMHLEAIHATLPGYQPRELYEYAPAAGKPGLREAWREKLLQDNPRLSGQLFSLPAVTNGLTHGLSIAADLFVDEGDAVLIADKNWEGFELIFGTRTGGQVVEYPFFDEAGQFHVDALGAAIEAQRAKGKAVLILNYPNNPTGYTPGVQEAERIAAVIADKAASGIQVVAIVDDAYFGMLYEEEAIKESLFGLLAGIHPNVHAVKIDGGTKEEYATGLRVGFITYASRSEAALRAMEQKTAGIICATIASTAHPSQTFLLRAMGTPERQRQKQQKYTVIRGRAHQVKAALRKPHYDRAWEVYPFNSGYFMCLKLKTVNARELRRHLLSRYGVGTVSLSDTDLRVAFPCIEEQHMDHLYSLIYQGVEDLEALGAGQALAER